MSAPREMEARAAASQRRASDPGVSAWVSANAGSGKTHLLVDRVIRLLLNGTPPERLLCLTFTRAAATEMASRLFDRIGEWVRLDDERLTYAVEKVCGTGFRTDLNAARRLFARALETPGGLKVQTIHAFCESLLHRFPLEAGIPAGFEVIDERDQREMLIAARSATLAAAATASDGSPAARALALAIARIQPEGFDKIIDEVVARRSRLKEMLMVTAGVEGIVRRLRTRLGLEPGDSVESLMEATVGANLPRKALKRLVEVLRQGSSRDQEHARRIEEALAKADREDCFAAYCRVFLTTAQVLRKKSGLMTAAIADAHPQERALFESEYDRFATLYERCKAAMVAEGTEALLTLAEAVLNRYEAEKRRLGRLDFDDLIERTLSLFSRAEAAWVLYKLDGGLDHVLVDEAQDTSPEQWRVIQYITEEFFAGEGARDTVRSIFAVGDEKQSIFSFQGADPAEFERMRRHFQARVREAEASFETVPLTVSFRSTREILRAVDLVFADERARKGLGEGDVPPHEPVRRGEPGLVEIWPPIVPEPSDEPDPWTAPLDWENQASPRQRLAEKIAATIRGWLDSGETLKASGRPIRPGDILVLVRRRDAFVEALMLSLKRRGIPVAGVDRLTLSQHIAVMDLMALGQSAVLPEDDLTLACLLKSPLVEKADGTPYDDDDLFSLAHGRPGTLWRSLRERAAADPVFAPAYEMLRRCRSRADWMPPFDFYARLLGPDGARRRFVARLGHEANDPIDEFLGLALDYERRHVPSLHGFLDWLVSAETEVKRDMEHGKDEVRIMTVHGAKGLEADVVFLPDTCTVPDQRHDPKLLFADDEEHGILPLWPISTKLDGELAAIAREKTREANREEHNRLLYVGLTRARDRLYVCGYETKQGRGEGCWHDLVLEALKPEAREIRDDDGNVLCWRLEGTPGPDAEPEPMAPAAPSAAAPHPPAPEPWMNRPPPVEAADRLLAPSHLELAAAADGSVAVTATAQPAGSPLGTSGSERFRRGRIVHTLLQMLPEVPREARRERARRYLEAPGHRLDNAARDDILDSVFAVLDHPEFAPLFAAGSRAEVAVTGRVPLAGAGADEIAIAGQIDRLAVTDDEVMIVDYKSNRPPPATIEDVAPLYIRQLAAYRLALARVFPTRTVRAALLWTEVPRLMELPAAVLDRAFEPGQTGR